MQHTDSIYAHIEKLKHNMSQHPSPHIATNLFFWPRWPFLISCVSLGKDKPFFICTDWLLFQIFSGVWEENHGQLRSFLRAFASNELRGVVAQPCVFELFWDCKIKFKAFVFALGPPCSHTHHQSTSASIQASVGEPHCLPMACSEHAWLPSALMALFSPPETISLVWLSSEELWNKNIFSSKQIQTGHLNMEGSNDWILSSVIICLLSHFLPSHAFIKASIAGPLCVRHYVDMNYFI